MDSIHHLRSLLKVLRYFFSFLFVLGLFCCGTASDDPPPSDEGNSSEIVGGLDEGTVQDEGSPTDNGTASDEGSSTDSSVTGCAPDEVMTANGCADCDNVVSNVSQQVVAIANSHRVCMVSSDCTSVVPQTGCMGFCPYAVATNQKALFINEIAEISDANCSDPDFSLKCGYMTPSCMETTAICEGGLCALQEVHECTDPNPQGCKEDVDCGDEEICKVIDGECFPSTCICDTASGAWICTDDCVGTCVEGSSSPCEGPNPQGCINTGCPEGQTCDQSQGNKPSNCNCSEATDPPNWNCTKDSGGGICVPD